jgi:hypothetical protein
VRNNNNNNNNNLLQILSCELKNKWGIFWNVIEWNYLKTEFLSGRLKRYDKGAGIEISVTTGFGKLDQCSVACRCRGSPLWLPVHTVAWDHVTSSLVGTAVSLHWTQAAGYWSRLPALSCVEVKNS